MASDAGVGRHGVPAPGGRRAPTASVQPARHLSSVPSAGRCPQAGPAEAEPQEGREQRQVSSVSKAPEGSAPDMRAYLRDYAAMMEAVPFPSFLHDRRWDVALANSAFDALFEGIRPHPTAMPGRNFLRFVLFHPDARNVLVEHETSWCLPMLAGFAEEMKSDTGSRDRALQAIRREIARDPIMEAAYCDGLPRWVRSVGTAAAHCDGAVRPLRHPDSRWGRTDCRLVSETPKALDGMGLSRVTLVLT